MNVPAKSDKPWYQSRTLIVNILAFLVLAIPMILNLPQFKPYDMYGGTVLALLNLGLRFLGDAPVVVPPSVAVDHSGDRTP